jgi:3D-(3,5/4)-trihydroxycyclohexane-1,2-dione acylhydrolase (decyclizing)
VAPQAWREEARRQTAAYAEHVRAAVAARPGASEPSYAQVIATVNAEAGPEDYAVSSAGGFPGELNVNWLSRGVATFDCEYGFSCMGYELAGAWGARMARSRGEVFAFVGDGSYLMLNSELLSSVITGHKLIAILCDNGGFAVIERLQVGQGGASFNNMFSGIGPNRVEIDWVAHARSLGCEAERVDAIDDLPAALLRARAAERTYVIAIRTAPDAWTEGGAFWQVGVPEVSERPAVDDARARQTEGRSAQRVGW